MSDVEWRPVVGFEGLYEVSDFGQVRSTKRKGTSGGLLVSSPGQHGHRHVTLWARNRQHGRTIHRLVMEAFVGPRPDGLEVRHLNGKAQDNRLANLAYGTHSENQQDCISHGTHGNGSKTHCIRGHEFNEANTRYRKSSGRDCRACYRERAAQKRATA